MRIIIRTYKYLSFILHYFVSYSIYNAVFLSYLLISNIINTRQKDLKTIKLKLDKKGNNGIFLRQGTSDISVFNQVFIKKEYDLPINFKPKHIVDLGANIGLTSLYLRNMFQNARIVAIEPDSSNFKILQKNLGTIDNVRAIHAAVWHNNCKLAVIDTGRKWGIQVMQSYENASEISEYVDGISIPTIVKLNRLNSIDILKIDIEGSERTLLSINTENGLIQ